MLVPVSILIPIKNEAANLPRCLACVRWADEVWVVDSASTDASAPIVAAEARRAEDEGRRGGGSVGGGAEGRKIGGSEPPNLGSSDPQFTQRVHLIQFHFNGTWPKKKNWALENLPFKHEWVFILDADEELPPEAEAEIRAIVDRTNRRTEDGGQMADGGGAEGPRIGGTEDRSAGTTDPQTLGPSEPPLSGDEIAGYWINRRFMFMGQWLKHAYYPNWNLRLFKHRLGRYEKLTAIDTASGDNEVHEHVIVQGRTARLRCEMNHYAFPSVEVFVEKHNRYSNWEARVAVQRAGERRDGGAEGRRVGGSEGGKAGVQGLGAWEPRSLGPSGHGISGTAAQLQMRSVGWRRRLKALSHRLPFRPTLRFCYVYFWQRGFLDGAAGYYFARMHAMYELLCVAKTAELRRRKAE